MGPAKSKSNKRGDMQEPENHSKHDEVKKTNNTPTQKRTGLAKRKRKPEEVDVPESELGEEGDNKNNTEGTEVEVTKKSYHSKL